MCNTKWGNLTEIMGELDEEVMKIIDEFIATNLSSEEGQEAIAACQQGMGVVGDRFQQGEYFVGGLIFAGELLTDTIIKLKAVIGSGASETVGIILLGSVH